MLSNKIKSLRIDIDALANAVTVNRRSTETDNAIKSLLLAKCWLGKLLGELGEETPYNFAYAADQIPPTTDVTDQKIDRIDDQLSNKYVAFVGKLRSEIEAVSNAVNRLPSNISVQYCTQHLSEARFHLGFELGRIRELSIQTLSA